MKILVNSKGYVIAHAAGFLFGAWEEQDTIHGMIVRKWKAEDENGNLLSYYVDENPRAITGAETPYFSVGEIEAFPDDYVMGKYLYLDGAFTLNPDWIEPEPSLEERVSALEIYSADLLYQVCLLQLGITEDEL